MGGQPGQLVQNVGGDEHRNPPLPVRDIAKIRRRMGAVVETPSIYLDLTARDSLDAPMVTENGQESGQENRPDFVKISS